MPVAASRPNNAMRRLHHKTAAGPTVYVYLGNTSPAYDTAGEACSGYTSTRAYYSLKATVTTIVVGDVIYDTYSSTPTNGNSKWVALRLTGSGPSYAFQINSSGVVLAVTAC